MDSATELQTSDGHRSTAAAMTSDRVQVIARWTLNSESLRFMRRSEYRAVARRLGNLLVCSDWDFCDIPWYCWFHVGLARRRVFVTKVTCLIDGHWDDRYIGRATFKWPFWSHLESPTLDFLDGYWSIPLGSFLCNDTSTAPNPCYYFLFFPFWKFRLS